MSPGLESSGKASFKDSQPASSSIVENTEICRQSLQSLFFSGRQSLLWPSGIWHSSAVAAHERFQPARTLITVILMRHMLISPINEGVWGKTSIYPSSIAHGYVRDGSLHTWDSAVQLQTPIQPPCWDAALSEHCGRTGSSLKRGFRVIQTSKTEFLLPEIWENI